MTAPPAVFVVFVVIAEVFVIAAELWGASHAESR